MRHRYPKFPKPIPPYASVVLQRVKYPHNVAAAIRACACFDAEELFYTGSRFEFVAGERLPREERMKGYRAVQWTAEDRPFDRLPEGVTPVCIELTPSAQPLTYFEHPNRACYVFGPEDGHVSQAFRALCHSFVYIPGRHCLNLAAAVNVVLAHRMMQQELDHVAEAPRPAEHEERGVMEIPSIVGWDGK